jgi:4'-phosphopantetheinyl transferase EntD
MLRLLLPADVVVVTSSDLVGTEPLYPEEATMMANAVPKRRREFASSRQCARTALRRLGAPDGPLLRGPNREPVWPAGVSGSITHCEGYCAAAVARSRSVRSIGIDAEVNAPLPRDVANRVTLSEERAWLEAAAGTGIALDRLLFSAKESVYKAWFPVACRWLGFEEVIVTVDIARQSFSAVVLTAGDDDGVPIHSFQGRYAATEKLVVTSVLVRPWTLP